MERRDVAVALTFGVGVGVAASVLFANRSVRNEPTLAEGSLQKISTPSRSLARPSDTVDKKLTLLEWENKQLRKELITARTQEMSTEDDVYLSGSDVERLRVVFDMLDTDALGTIPVADIPKLCAKLGVNLDEDRLNEMYKHFSNDPEALEFRDFLIWWSEVSCRGQFNPFKLTRTILKNFDPKKVRLNASGQASTPEYRIFYEYEQKNGRLKQISPWHDIPLWSTPGIVHFVCEIPKWTRAKYEIAVDETHNPIKQDTRNGKLRYYQHGDMMFNYGAFPQTWENPKHVDGDTGCIGDNDPIDAVEIGTHQLTTGSVTAVKPLGILALLDDGETDWKVVCININDPLAKNLNDVHDVEKQMPGALEAIRTYFRTYKVCRGQPENKFGMGGMYKPAKYTMARIRECHEQWQYLQETGQRTAAYGEHHAS